MWLVEICYEGDTDRYLVQADSEKSAIEKARNRWREDRPATAQSSDGKEERKRARFYAEELNFDNDGVLNANF